MRSMLSATLIFVAAVTSAQAQTTPSSPANPKRTAAKAARPALQSPAETANAMGQGERLAIQSDLAWVGKYNGAISGDVSERMVESIKEFQKANGGKPTGVLNPKERSVLAETGRRRRENAGWKIVTDAPTGAQLGIPTKLVPQQTSDADGTKWSSASGTVQVLLTRRKEANPTSAKLAEHEKKEPIGRNVDYTVVKPEFFVLSGLQGLKKFYVRGTFKGDEVRILTILYDQATENTVEPVVIAMSSFLPSRCVRCALSEPSGTLRSASMLQYSWVLNASISISRSQTRRSATDCTRPADFAPGSLRHSTGESVKPTR